MFNLILNANGRHVEAGVKWKLAPAGWSLHDLLDFRLLLLLFSTTVE